MFKNIRETSQISNYFQYVDRYTTIKLFDETKKNNAIRIQAKNNDLLIIDIDDMNDNNPLLEEINKLNYDELNITHSSQFTLEEIKNNRCLRHKIIFRCDEQHLISVDVDKDVEIFFNNNHYANVRGSRHYKKDNTHMYVNVLHERTVLRYIPESLLNRLKTLGYLKTKERQRQSRYKIGDDKLIYYLEEQLLKSKFNSKNYDDLHVEQIKKSANGYSLTCLFHEKNKQNVANIHINERNVVYSCFGTSCKHQHKEVSTFLTNRRKNYVKIDKPSMLTNVHRDVCIKAPTGSGKTDDMIKLIVHNKQDKLTIALKDKENIKKFIKRFKQLTKTDIKVFTDVQIVQQNTKINDDARVYITHHHYFKSKHHSLEEQPKLFKLVHERIVVIDEADELIYSLRHYNNLISALYKRSHNDLFYLDRQTRFNNNDDMHEHVEFSRFDLVADIFESYKYKFKQTVQIDDKSSVKECHLLDELKLYYNEVSTQQIENIHVSTMKRNNINCVSVHKNVYSICKQLDTIHLCKKQSDEYKRKDVNTITLIAFTEKLLNNLINACKYITFVSATFSYTPCELIEFEAEKKIKLLNINLIDEYKPDDRVTLYVASTNEHAVKFMREGRGYLLKDSVKSYAVDCDDIPENITIIGMNNSESKGLTHRTEVENIGYQRVVLNNFKTKPLFTYFSIDEHGNIIDDSTNILLNDIKQVVGRATRQNKEVLDVDFINLEDNDGLITKLKEELLKTIATDVKIAL